MARKKKVHGRVRGVRIADKNVDKFVDELPHGEFSKLINDMFVELYKNKEVLKENA